MDTTLPSRDAMHGLILPPDIAFWPATPAWAVVGLLVALLLGWAAWRGWRRWQAAAYRREALRALDAADQPAEVARILKRTALAAWPREAVASLAGTPWAAFLRRTAPRARLDEGTAAALATASHDPRPLPVAQLRDAAARWIRHHDARA